MSRLSVSPRAILAVGLTVVVVISGFAVITSALGKQPSSGQLPTDSGYAELSTSAAAMDGTPPTIGTQGSYQERWNFTMNEEDLTNPTMVGGTVYFGGDDFNDSTKSHMYAVDEATGTLEWRAALSGSNRTRPHTPFFYRNTVYLTSFPGRAYALNADTGAERWAKSPSDSGLRKLGAIQNGTLYVGSGFNHPRARVFALDYVTGDARWTFIPNGEWASAPAVAGDTVYVGTRNGSNYGTPNASYSGTVYALDAATGDVRWTFNTQDFQAQRLAVADGTVYVATQERIIKEDAGEHITQDDIRREGEVFALDATTGAKRWSVSANSKVQGPVVVNDTVYFTSEGDRTYAVTAAAGDMQWTFTHPRNKTGHPAVADGSVYVRSGQTVYELDAETGTQTETITRDGHIDAGPTVANGTLYVAYGSRNAGTTMYALTEREVPDPKHTPTLAAGPTPTQGSDGPAESTPTPTATPSPSPDAQSGPGGTEGTTTSTGTQATTAPGFGLGVAVVAVTLVGYLIARQRR